MPHWEGWMQWVGEDYAGGVCVLWMAMGPGQRGRQEEDGL
jgi:hypothetical protein